MQERNFLPNVYQGTIRPVPRRKFEVPAHQAVQQLGLTAGSKYFTNCRIWVRKANKDFDNYGIFISFSNGLQSTFARLNGVDELRKFADFIVSQANEIEKLVPSLQIEAEAIQKANEQYQKTVQMIQMVRGNQDFVSPDDEIPEEVVNGNQY